MKYAMRLNGAPIQERDLNGRARLAYDEEDDELLFYPDYGRDRLKAADIQPFTGLEVTVYSNDGLFRALFVLEKEPGVSYSGAFMFSRFSFRD